MSDGDLQDRFIGPVVDRERHLDAGDVDVAHDAGAGDVEDAVVGLDLLVRQHEPPGLLHEVLVECFRLSPHAVEILFIHVCNLRGISCDRTGLVEGVPPVTEGRIHEQADSDEENQHQNDIAKLFSHFPVYPCRYACSRVCFNPRGAGVRLCKVM